MLGRETGRRLSDALSSLMSYRDLRKNEEFLDNLVEHIPDMIFVKDAQTLRFVRFNRAGEQLVGYPREELLGKNDYDFFTREEADFFTAKDRQVLESKELVDIPEETIRNSRNEERILHTKKNTHSGRNRSAPVPAGHIRRYHRKWKRSANWLAALPMISTISSLSSPGTRKYQDPLTDIIIGHTEHCKRYPDAKPGEYIMLSVSDQGHGIDAHDISRIFDPFFTTKEKGEGTGMGLSVVHGIVQSYRGFIYVRSRPGGGSTFDILIPALKGAATVDLMPEKPIPMGSEFILFVDDETMIVDIGKSMLESLGYRVVAKGSASDALETFSDNPESFDLVVTDMIMPKMTGLDLAEKIIRIRPDIPIVMCTGFGANVSEENATRHGVRDIIFKPILRRDLATAIRRALEGR